MSTPSSHGYSVSEASRSVTDSDASFVTGEENVNGVRTDAVAEGGANGMSECGEIGAHAAIDEHLQLSIEPDMIDSTHSEQHLAQGLRLTSENSGERLMINEEHALNSSSNDSNVEENICNGERDTRDKCDSTSSAALTPRTEEDGYRISTDESLKEDDIISVSCEERSVDVPVGDEEHDVLSMHNERSSSLLPSFNRTDSGSNSCSTLSDADSVSRVYEEQITRSSFISDTTNSLVAHSEMAPHASKAVNSPLNSLGEHPSRTDNSVAGVVGYAHQDRNAATGVDEECSVSPESGAECLDHQDVSTDNETNKSECVVREDEDISFSGSPDAYVGDTSSDRISNEVENAQNLLASTTGEVILDDNSEDDGENDCLINRTSETDDGAFFCTRPHGGDFVSSSPIRATRQSPNIDEIESHNLQRSTTMSSEFHASQLSVHDSISDEPEPVDSPGNVDENGCSRIASAGSKQLGLSAESLSRKYPDRSAEETQLLRDLLAVPVVTALTVQSCADDDHVDLDKASVIANPASGEPHLECTPPGSRDGDDTLSLGSPTSTASPRDSPLDGGSPVAPPHTSPSAGDGEVRQPSGDAEQRSSHVESSKEAGQGTGFVYVASDFEPEPKRRDRAPSSSSTPPDHAVPDEDGAMALDEAYTDVKTPFIEGELASGQRWKNIVFDIFCCCWTP